MKKLKYSLLYIITFVKRRRALVLIFGLVLIFLFGLFFALSTIAKQPPTISEGLIGSISQNDLPELVTHLLSEGLFTIDKTGIPKPAIAQSWTVNQDGTVYTVFIKDNLKWSDGTILRAQDLDVRINGVKTVVVDDHTLQFKLSESFSPFLTLLNKPIFRKNSWVGVGPYAIQTIVNNTNNSFVKKIDLHTSNTSLPNISIHFYPSEQTAQEALRLGNVESLIGINELSTLKGNNDLAFWSEPNYSQLVTIFYNTSDKTLTDENLRLGLSFAAPQITGEATAVTSIPPNNWAFNQNVKDYLDNPDAAKTALAKVHDLSNDKIVLTATSSLEKVGQQVVDAWRKYGVNVDLKVESGVPQDFQSLLIENTIPLDPDQYALWHSTQTDTNITHFSSPRVDKDLEEGRKATDSATRKTNYLDFQKTLLDHAPATFLYFPKFNVVYMKKIEGLITKVLLLQAP